MHTKPLCFQLALYLCSYHPNVVSNHMMSDLVFNGTCATSYDSPTDSSLKVLEPIVPKSVDSKLDILIMIQQCFLSAKKIRRTSMFLDSPVSNNSEQTAKPHISIWGIEMLKNMIKSFAHCSFVFGSQASTRISSTSLLSKVSHCSHRSSSA